MDENEIIMEEVENMETSNSVEVKDENMPKVWDLTNKEDREELEEIVNSGSIFFKLEEGVSYKIKLNSTQVKEVKTTFKATDEDEEKEVTKYELAITSKGSDKSEFEGVWQVGVGVMNTIFKEWENSEDVFNVSRTGKGLKTRYNISKDF